jgi:DNA-binding NarL/FixJ family response regulator
MIKLHSTRSRLQRRYVSAFLGSRRRTAQQFVESEPFAPGFPVDLITERQLEVFKLLGLGYSNSQIAQELHVSVNTVRTFCARIKEKLKISNARKLLREAVLWRQRQHFRNSYAGGQRALLAGARGRVQERQPAKNGLRAVYFCEKIALTRVGRALENNFPATDSAVGQLSKRELEVFRLLGSGCGTGQIAQEMRISFKTVHSFRGRIKEKLKLSSATEVLREALRWHDKQALK